MLFSRAKSAPKNDHPIEDTLHETARILNLSIPPRLPYMTATEALLLQAQISKERALRIAALEAR